MLPKAEDKFLLAIVSMTNNFNIRIFQIQNSGPLSE